MVAGTSGSVHKAGTTKMTQTITTAGIDVSKNKLDAAVHGGSERWQVANGPAGWRTLATAFERAGVQRVGLESTGGYERGVVGYLRKRGFTVLVLHPFRVRAYAHMKLQRAKNDAIDAVLIAACTTLNEVPEIEPDERLARLADHLTYVEQLEEDLTRWKTRLEHARNAAVRRAIEAEIKQLAKRRAKELGRLIEALRQHADLARRFDLVLSVPGIGERTALALVVRLPELGRVSREKIASLAGLAPFDDDTGKHKGERHIGGGRKRVRRSLYAAALPASWRWNEDLVNLYKRLTARGKAHKEALTACARKLLIYANTVVARGTPWVSTGAAA
jgi:transposase